MSSNFDEAIEEQVSRFNRRLEASASRQKRLVKALCIERMLDDYASLQDRSMATSSTQPATAGGIAVDRTMREHFGEVGRWLLRRVMFPQEREGRPIEDKHVVIEGEYVVINTAADADNTTRNDRESEITKRQEKDNGQG